jgi:hypothetical protein
MDRGELLDRVMNNYRRFYMKKALFHYPWRGTGFRRRYLLGCLKAFLKAGFQRTFYDLGKVGYWGPQSKKVDFHFDDSSFERAQKVKAARKTAGAQNRGTFAGEGRLRLLPGHPMKFLLQGHPLAFDGCPWHRAVFQQLFRTFVSPRAAVAHVPATGPDGPGDLLIVTW